MHTVMMRFRVEQIYLTDESGRIVPAPGRHPLFYLLEATSVDQLLDSFVSQNGGEIVGEVLRFPGFQAIATVKRDQSVYTLQILPASDRIRVER